MTEFVTITTVEQLKPGERIIVEIGSHWIAVFNIDGQYYAIEDRCTHDDGPLADGELEGCDIECPRHGARFDVRTGKVSAPPALVAVQTYQVRVEGRDVQLATEPTKAG
ncbi:MAG: non-heme iron oxygenase ferredoxin subunit [Chloroflexi bacterium]|nr:non-heme iron oxygenase ferredoxin subunit [Chloroflexota bacterium]